MKIVNWLRKFKAAQFFACLVLFFSFSIATIANAANDIASVRRYRHQEVYGQVVHVSDGDTLILQTAQGEKFKLRLYAIDAPEKAQPYGPQSTGILRNLIGNKYIRSYVEDIDRYGRMVARVYYDRQDINAEMVRLGAAWHYKAYDKSGSYQKYADLELFARNNHKGLWNRENPLPPWEYRRLIRAQHQARSY